MRDYEIVYIFRPTLESDDVEAKLETFHDGLDGEITAVEHWGQRQLAYEIQDERKGYYVVTQFRAEPSALAPFEQGLRHDEELIRHLIVLSEGELPTPPSRRGEEEEEEEKEEKEEKGGEEEEPEEQDEEDEEEGEEAEEEDGEDEDEEEGEEEDEEEDEDEDEEDEDEEEGEDDDEPGADEASEDEEK